MSTHEETQCVRLERENTTKTPGAPQRRWQLHMATLLVLKAHTTVGATGWPFSPVVLGGFWPWGSHIRFAHARRRTRRSPFAPQVAGPCVGPLHVHAPISMFCSGSFTASEPTG